MMKRIMNFFEVYGYARAASEFTRLGRHDLAKKCMEEASKIK